MAFFNSLSFTSSNEDGCTELAAFAQNRPNRLLCLTGSGSRVLDMCLANPEELIALDLNPIQNELLQLKIAAFKVLNDQDLLGYLGVTPCKNRLELHGKVERALTQKSQFFWQTHQGLIAKGLWYSGLWEKVLRFGAFGNHVIRGKKIDQLFAAPSLEEQADMWRRHFDDKVWRLSLRLLGRRWIWTKLIGEPGGSFLPAPDIVEKRLADAFIHASESFFFRDSDFASLILRGHHAPPFALPLHLQKKYTDSVRNNLDKIQIITGGLTQLRSLGISNIDAFSVSDFGSYCSQEAYDQCWSSLREAAAPGATVCEREFLNALPPRKHEVIWDLKKSEALSRADKSFIYKIRVGQFQVATKHA